MTKYVQKPAGWWQDDKGRMQPPGSFQDPSLRVDDKLSPETADRPIGKRRARTSPPGRESAGEYQEL
ncbi:MAG: hypothetical protein WCF24_07640 [Acidimicrobiales bacterium]